MRLSGLVVSIALLCSSVSLARVGSANRTDNVIGGPKGPYPYLFKGSSDKRLVETARDHSWSINFHRSSSARTDTLHLLALRVEFNGGKRDTSLLTTGNGLFSMRNAGKADMDELKLYNNSDTVYRYDRFPHDSIYFAHQLYAVAAYYRKVSRGSLHLTHTVLPRNRGTEGFAVDSPMTTYSPGGKRKKETWDDYYYRKTRGLMRFVKEALEAAGRDPNNSPFSGLTRGTDGIIRNEQGTKTAILIFHAGASYLTDGGEQGAFGQNSPSDMIDAFVNKEFFKYFQDTLKLKQPGISVAGASDSAILIDELMMCSETSNQDGLNWGIQGILVNQVARQLGIPDLYSTTSGISGIGAFCIMDFAGYSAGNGFIPPYPSAWVRAFMGWDNVHVASIGAGATHRVKALSLVLDRAAADSAQAATNDTTILLVPINDHEYYLIENRQRNLSGSDSLFRYDSTELGKNIAPYPYNVNVDSNVTEIARKDSSRVIQRVRNNDISLPASGVLIWHIDERIIRDRLRHNMVNADSAYRGISLVEADGVTDLGVQFTDVFYQAAFDYGGAEDVFPHRTEIKDSTPLTVTGFGPFTRPSSRSNDGGHTYLKLDVAGSGSNRVEKTVIRNYTVANFSDSAFSINVSWDYLVPGWPKRAAPDRFFAPLLCDLDSSQPGNELFLLGSSGRAYAWNSAATSAGGSYGNRIAQVTRFDLRGDTVAAPDTIFYLDSIPGAVAMPSALDGKVYIPSSEGTIRVLQSLGTSGGLWQSIALGAVPSSYVCHYADSVSWAIGCENGLVIFGQGTDTSGSLKLKSPSPVCALSALKDGSGALAAIQVDGSLSICAPGAAQPDTTVLIGTGIGPYTLVSGNLDGDSSTSEIVVCDSRHGLWMFTRSLALAPGWEAKPNDWATAYSYVSNEADRENRSLKPINLSPPALADINRDGRLDILVSGTNGIYAFNYKGALISGWPAYLDNRYWYQRGSVLSSPIVVTGTERQPLIVFSSPSGENATFRVTRIDSANTARGLIWFKNDDGTADSIWGVSAGLIDTLLNENDSLVAPYVLPGGFIDAIDARGKRPAASASLTGTTSRRLPQSAWPFTAGSSVQTSPLAGYMDTPASLDLFAVTRQGWVYRWKPSREILPDTLFWPQDGYDAGRSFAYGGAAPPTLVTERDPITFFSYPNPTNGSKSAVLKYKFSAPAQKVRIDIYTFTGYLVYSQNKMGNPPHQLTGSYPDWNELVVPLDKFGPAVYRCRIEATVNGKKHARYWKMAVIK